MGSCAVLWTRLGWCWDEAQTGSGTNCPLTVVSWVCVVTNRIRVSTPLLRIANRSLTLSLLMLRWGADKVVPQMEQVADHLSDCQELGVRSCLVGFVWFFESMVLWTSVMFWKVRSGSANRWTVYKTMKDIYVYIYIKYLVKDLWGWFRLLTINLCEGGQWGPRELYLQLIIFSWFFLRIPLVDDFPLMTFYSLIPWWFIHVDALFSNCLDD